MTGTILLASASPERPNRCVAGHFQTGDCAESPGLANSRGIVTAATGVRWETPSGGLYLAHEVG
jgi:hypothetical protein